MSYPGPGPDRPPYNNRLTIIYPPNFPTPPGVRPRISGLGDDKFGPQRKVDEFWESFTSKNPGKVTNIIPKNEYAEKLAKRTAAKDLTNGGSGGKTTSTSYEEAAALCRAKVEKIVKECKRVNQKYRDPHFDLEWDLKTETRDCLESLSNRKSEYPDYFGSDNDEPRPPPPGWNPRGRPREETTRQKAGKNRGRGEKVKELDIGSDEESDHARGAQTWYQRGSRKQSAEVRAESPGARLNPRSVKRVGDIFEDPKFFIKGPTADDVRQGRDGDCWLLAALCTLSNKPGLIERVCVARDENVGVYGFVFNRDGEWFSEIIDDKLYLIKQDYDELVVAGSVNHERQLWDDIENRTDPEEIFRRAYQSGSTALYFAQCENPNETWLPLLEKAYAKAHGDYQAIDGGFTAEGIEDLTGGVTSELHATDILDKDAFWNNELMKVNQDFLFGCSTGHLARGYGSRRGIVEKHAYSVMRAVEIDGVRLVMLKNPWGKGEWRGAWSDGSKEWTPEWLIKLNHKFGDDGSFWMSYKDLLRKYQRFERTRLFGPEWKITSIWTTLNVPWAPEYHHTKFAFNLERSGPVVIVLAQLDERYFRGLHGRYDFLLGFRVHKAGEEDYIVRCQASGRGMSRSISVELDLEAGEYTVLVRIESEKYSHLLEPEEVLRMNARDRRDKLLRIGLAYDLAHSKAKIAETEEEKAAREAYEKRQKEKHRERIRKAELENRRKESRQDWRTHVQNPRMRQAYEDKWRAKRQARREAKIKAAREAKEARLKEEEQKKKADAKVADGEAGQEKPEGEAEEADINEKPKVDEGTQTEIKTDEQSKMKEEVKTDKETQTEAEAQDEPAAETAEPDVSTVGENTPSLSSSGALAEKNPAAPEARNVPAASDEEVKQEEVTAEPAQEATTGPTDEAAEDPSQNTNVDEQGPVDTASQTEDIDTDPVITSKLKQALEVVTNFKAELEGLLGSDPEHSSHAHHAHRHEHPLEQPPQPRHHHAAQPHFHPPQPHYHPRQPPMQPDSRPPSQPPSQPSSRAPSRAPTSYPHPHPHPHRRRGRGRPSPDDIELSDDDFITPPMSPYISEDELDCLVADNDQFAFDNMNAITAQLAPRFRGPPPGPPPPMGGGRHRVDDDDPWNAVVAVGLRVYYKVEEEDKDREGLVKLRVVRPNEYELSDDGEEEEGKKEGGDDKAEEKGGEKVEEEKVLDVDDSAKDATVEGGLEHTA
ncbi:putative calpain-1 catalytic subunit [Triangularia verruculosa]|uniref:Calpain-1 catalytic subunit n=1 Tax=Triangularia verruculosa TaxID=2587418 RepID=A0AAN6X6U8_9PEZI|nr:putative calpain-1 catalytic subunit [Triangularia verruculosa]